jgi:hypothetical protein
MMSYEGLWWVYPPSGFRSASSHPVPLRYSRTERSPTRLLFYLIRMRVVHFDRLYFAKLWSSLWIVVVVISMVTTESDRWRKKTLCFALRLLLMSSYDHYSPPHLLQCHHSLPLTSMCGVLSSTEIVLALQGHISSRGHGTAAPTPSRRRTIHSNSWWGTIKYCRCWILNRMNTDDKITKFK